MTARIKKGGPFGADRLLRGGLGCRRHFRKPREFGFSTWQKFVQLGNQLLVGPPLRFRRRPGRSLKRIRITKLRRPSLNISYFSPGFIFFCEDTLTYSSLMPTGLSYMKTPLLLGFLPCLFGICPKFLVCVRTKNKVSILRTFPSRGQFRKVACIQDKE